MQNVQGDVSVRVNTSRKLDVFSCPFKGGGEEVIEEVTGTCIHTVSLKREKVH